MEQAHKSLKDSFPAIFGSDYEKARETFYKHYYEMHLEHLKPLPYAEELLIHLHREKFHLGVVSNKLGTILRKEANHFGWNKYFYQMIGSMDVSEDKPSPVPIFEILKELEIEDYSQVWLVGDTPVDVECAKKAGCIPIFYGKMPEKDIVNILDHNELIKLIKTEFGVDGYLQNLPQQKAFITMLYIPGYFLPERVWQDVNSMGGFQDPLLIYEHILNVMNDAKAYPIDPMAFNSTYVIKNLFNNELFDKQDIQDFITYWGQTAFDRKIKQERNEIFEKDWLIVFAEEYLKSAQVLGLVSKIEPKYRYYDEVWVQGASRQALLDRLEYIKKYEDAGIQFETIRILNGDRELWAEIEGVNNGPNIDIELGKIYMLDLAIKNGFKINDNQPFVKYEKEENLPLGRVKNRTYINYADGETRVLDEAIMSEDIKKVVFGERPIEVLPPVVKTGYRAETYDTAYFQVNYFLMYYQVKKAKLIKLMC
ncbi:HAD-superfamily hydrolase, subfamily IA [Reticulomyxa filosa]|uniref:HAD-superfamily hydrolase, subfamily IA n=1 Tax=Reticulomyxa filosa TaxID=46433 RepID=X6MUY6_RETFI|nr:HAD-superfamily hydrolase, subfamily IA [Reticulomyxa filosa]|eukprot:ETO16890.1 HAD-superfamily hydrolase, subfamily IA [Reticulomyxa filosa]